VALGPTFLRVLWFYRSISFHLRSVLKTSSITDAVKPQLLIASLNRTLKYAVVRSPRITAGSTGIPPPHFLLYMTPCWGKFVGEDLQFESLRLLVLPRPLVQHGGGAECSWHVGQNRVAQTAYGNNRVT